MNLSLVTVSLSLLLFQLVVAAENACQTFPGLPGRDGRDGVPGPAGPPGTSEISYTAYRELRERLMSDILNDPRFGAFSKNTKDTCPPTLKLSCKEIYDCNPDSPSGYYWISKDSSPPEQVYCGMNLTHCGNITGGWRRVAHFNMTSPEGTCPSSLTTITSPRSCSRGGGAGCSSVTYTTFGVHFTRVCGQAIGYRHHTVDGFFGYAGLGKGIDSPYVDGLSITYDTPRRHLWTYAAGVGYCPCAGDRRGQPPSFVQDHYYCEAGNVGGSQGRWYTADPLWDGEGCPTGNTCCDPPNLPWFNRVIDTPSTADIEMRLCQDQIAADEDFAVEQFELYVY